MAEAAASRPYHRASLVVCAIGLLTVGLGAPSVGESLVVAAKAAHSVWPTGGGTTYGNFDRVTVTWRRMACEQGFAVGAMMYGWPVFVVAVGIWAMRSQPRRLVTRIARHMP